MKRFLYVNILGVTRTPQLSQVRITRPLLDLGKMKTQKGGFRVLDYIATEEFEYLNENAKEFDVYNEYSISCEDTHAFLKSKGDITSDVIVGSQWWLRNEKISILEVNYISSEDITNIKIKRGVDNTFKQNIFGDYYKHHYLRYSRYNTLMYSYKIANFKRDYRGLIVELRTREGLLQGVGVIKDLNVTNGVAVIDCDDMADLVGADFEKSSFFEIIKNASNSDLGQALLTAKNSFGAMLGVCYVASLPMFNWFDKTKMRFSNIPLYRYIDIDSYREFKQALTGFLGRITVMSSDEVREIQNSLDFPKINVPDNKKVLDLLQFLSGYFLIFDETIGKYKFVNILGVRMKELEAIKDERNLMNDLLVPKVVSNQFGVIGNVSIKWLDRTTYISITGFAGISTNNTISLEVYRNFSLSYENEFRERIEDNYLMLQSLAVAELKVQIPEPLIQEKYQVGTKFKIKDIDKFYTYQVTGKEVFTYGIVTGYDKDIVKIVVVANLYFTPIAPSVKVIAEGREDVNGVESIKFKVLNLEELSDIDNDLTNTLVNGYFYFSSGNDVIIKAKSAGHSYKYSSITKIAPTYLYIDASVFSTGEEEYYNRIEYPNRIKLGATYDTGEEYNDLMDNQKSFFYLGVDRWI